MPVIRVESLSKRYRLGTIGRTALHEDLARWWARLHGRPDPTLRLDQLQQLEARAAEARDLEDDADHIWALRNVSFDVKQGEVLGIIGRNGAGKSTLLKILSRVTAPTLGCVKVKGRIASLLEVGTGFNPEMTGRENIFLNGAILGMTRAEVRSKFDEIVDFSEVAAFIDTPVKRYSSGMYVRLAFAVAAHLEPEILVVDEVLAVGDAAFQRKCLGKMGDVAGRGRTILFVSHNMGSVRSLCSTVMWLRDGQNVCIGDAAEVIDRYLRDGVSETGSVEIAPDRHRTMSSFRIVTVELMDDRGRLTSQLPFGSGATFRLGMVADEPIADMRVGIALRCGGLSVCSLHTPPFDMPASAQPIHIVCGLPAGVLMPANYDLHVGAHIYSRHRGLDWVADALGFSVSNVSADGRDLHDRRDIGIISVPAEWSGIPS